MARSPLGAYLLARKGRDYCAVKFTRYWESEAASKPTIFSDGAASRHALYEAAHLIAHEPGSEPKLVRIKRGRVDSLPSIGIGHLAFARGDDLIDCGRFALSWAYPVRVRYHPTEGARFAITRNGDLALVQFGSPELSWYPLDKSGTRKRIEASIDSYCCLSQK